MTRIIKTRESGLYKLSIEDTLNYFRKRISQLIRKEKSPSVGYSQLAIKYIFDLFYLLLFLHFISILLFVEEITYFIVSYYRYSKRSVLFFSRVQRIEG